MTQVTVEFESMGGYDCMSDAFTIKQGTQTLAVVDLRHFPVVAQGSHASLAQLDAINRARKIAECIGYALDEMARGDLL